jgi:hypothetical protein
MRSLGPAAQLTKGNADRSRDALRRFLSNRLIDSSPDHRGRAGSVSAFRSLPDWRQIQRTKVLANDIGLLNLARQNGEPQLEYILRHSPCMQMAAGELHGDGDSRCRNREAHLYFDRNKMRTRDRLGLPHQPLKVRIAPQEKPSDREIAQMCETVLATTVDELRVKVDGRTRRETAFAGHLRTGIISRGVGRKCIRPQAYWLSRRVTSRNCIARSPTDRAEIPRNPMTRLQAKQLALTRLRLHERPSAGECRQTKKHISNLHRRPTLSPAGEGTFATASRG